MFNKIKGTIGHISKRYTYTKIVLTALLAFVLWLGKMKTGGYNETLILIVTVLTVLFSLLLVFVFIYDRKNYKQKYHDIRNKRFKSKSGDPL